MKVSLGLPTHRVDRGNEFVTADAVAALAVAAESAGFDAVFVTEHPFPSDDWLATGGHHALDPLVALAVAATATTRLRLHTNLFVPAYRNPFLGAKAVATLDVLSRGRVILGIGTGYLEGEFDALGVPFNDRNDRTDAAIRAMQTAWTGASVTLDGDGFHAAGNTMLPRPVQRPHPPIWVGGNSRRAIRRAVELGDGWSPFPVTPERAVRNRTVPLATAADLGERIAYARELAASMGRTAPLDIIFMPSGLSASGPPDTDAVIASANELAGVGVRYLAVGLAGDTVAAQIDAIESFGATVLPALGRL